jgi:hypothetical protein
LLPRLVRRIDPDSHTASTEFVSSGPDHWRLLLFVVDLQALHTTPTITTWTTRSQSLVLSLPCSPSSSRGRGAGISEVAARFVFVKQRFLCVVLLLVGLCCSGPGSGRADAEGCAEAPFRFVCVRFVSFACLVGVLLVCVVVFCASARALTGCLGKSRSNSERVGICPGPCTLAGPPWASDGCKVVRKKVGPRSQGLN